MKYAVISNDASPFLLGRYNSLPDAQKAVGSRPDLWLIYQLKEPKRICDDFGRCNCLRGYCDKGLKND